MYDRAGSPLILPEMSGMTGTLSTCTHPGASLSYEVTGTPYPSLIFSPMASRIHHARPGALDIRLAPSTIIKINTALEAWPQKQRRNFAWQLPLQPMCLMALLPTTPFPLCIFLPLKSSVISPGICHDQTTRFGRMQRGYELKPPLDAALHEHITSASPKF